MNTMVKVLTVAWKIWVMGVLLAMILLFVGIMVAVLAH